MIHQNSSHQGLKDEGIVRKMPVERHHRREDRDQRLKIVLHCKALGAQAGRQRMDHLIESISARNVMQDNRLSGVQNVGYTPTCA